MTDNEIIKALECCTNDDNEPNCKECTKRPHIYCICELLEDAYGLIQRQRVKIDELTDRVAIRSIDKIHYNIAEMNLIKAGFDMVELQKRFRAEFEEKMELGIDDCINWADWLDSIVSEMQEEAKKGVQND